MNTANPRTPPAADQAGAGRTAFSVLFVDDDPIARETVVARWSDEDCSVDVAGDGAEACLTLAERTYDVMLLDLSMPKFDGFDVLRYARSHAHLRNMPIVVLTSRSDDEARKQARAAGATLFYTKPTDWTVLKQDLQALVSAGRASAPAAEPEREQRAHPRDEVLRRAMIVHQTTGDSFPCLVLQISEGGARLQLLSPALPDDDLTLVDAGSGAVRAFQVTWRAGPLIGVTFTEPAA